MYGRLVLAAVVLVGLLQVTSALDVVAAAVDDEQPLVEGPLCNACLDLFTDLSTAFNSSESINLLMEFVHDQLCLEFWGQYNLSAECLVWYYDNYEILIQLFQFALDGLAWDVLAPDVMCTLLGFCDPEQIPVGDARLGEMKFVNFARIPNFDKFFEAAKAVLDAN